MTVFSQFALSFGIELVSMAVIAAWLFRKTGAPLWQRIVVPAISVAACAYAPYAVNSMMGLAVSATIAELPDKATLIAFQPAEGERRVDLWLLCCSLPPRAYEVDLSPQLEDELRKAQERQRHGQQVVLSHARPMDGEQHDGRRSDLDERTGYVIDESAISHLPPKE
jgi:hypothetical protein